MNTLIKSVKLRAAATVMGTAMMFMMVYSCGNNTNRNDETKNEEFVTEAASSNSLEIAAGRMAASRAQDPLVQSFGQQMVEDHTAMQEEMKSIADAKGWTVPSELLRKHERKLEKISDLNGAEFDREFVDLMIESHEDAVDLFTDFVEAGDNPRNDNNKDRRREVDAELRDFVSGRIPALRAHLDKAKQLKDSVDARRDTTRSAMDVLKSSIDSAQRRDPMN